MSTILCAVVAAVLAASAVLGGLGDITQQDQPTFNSGVEYIEVDVLVTDKNGAFVRGLTPSDFALLEDGQPQPIASFSLVDLSDNRPVFGKRPVSPIEPDITTNTGRGRLYVIALNASGAKAHRSRLVARRFVDEAVGPYDQVAVVPVCGTMSASQGFTQSRLLMLAAIDRLLTSAHAERQDESDVPIGCGRDRATVSFEVIEEMAQKLGRVTGRRKVVLWFDPPSVFQAMDASVRFAQRDALRAATRNNVALYVIDTQGLTTNLGAASLDYKAGLRLLAEDTGGDVIVDSNNFSQGFQRFVRDNDSYYLLGYTPSVVHRDGKFHRLTVRVNRPDLVVRARRGYYAPQSDATVASDAPVVSGLSAATAEALRMPLSVDGLEIELFAAPFKGDGGNASVLLGARVRGTGLVLGEGERIEVAHQAMTAEGTITPGAFHVMTLDFRPASREAIAQTAVSVLDRLELGRGRHQVRFAVHQPNGKTGSVVADVEVPNYSNASLIVSGLVLASTDHSAERTLMDDAALQAILGAPPTARRRFAQNETITAFVEVYTRSGTNAIRVNGTLSPVSERRGRTARATLVTDAPGRAGYTVRFPLTSVAPGEYVLTVEAQAGDHVAQRQILVNCVDRF